MRILSVDHVHVLAGGVFFVYAIGLKITLYVGTVFAVFDVGAAARAP